MSHKIEAIEGIGPEYGARLRAAGVASVRALLEAGRTPAGRARLAEQTGISPALIMSWVDMADLFRVRGVAGQRAELLERAGVDTVKELRNRDAETLTRKLAAINDECRLSRTAPGVTTVRRWIEEAKTLPPAVDY